MRIFITTIGLYQIYFEDLTKQAPSQTPWSEETFRKIQEKTKALFAAYAKQTSQDDSILEISSLKGKTDHGRTIQSNFYLDSEPNSEPRRTARDLFRDLLTLLDFSETRTPLEEERASQTTPVGNPPDPVVESSRVATSPVATTPTPPVPNPTDPVVESPRVATSPVAIPPTPPVANPTDPVVESPRLVASPVAIAPAPPVVTTASAAEPEEAPLIIPVLSTELDLKAKKLSLPTENAPLQTLKDWYERIPGRTRLRICRHVAMNYDILFPVERLASRYLKESQKDIHKEIHELERKTHTDSKNFLEILIRDYYLKCLNRTNTVLQESIRKLYIRLDQCRGFKIYFNQQLNAQKMPLPTGDSWHPLHYTCCIQALERFLDNS